MPTRDEDVALGLAAIAAAYLLSRKLGEPPIPSPGPPVVVKKEEETMGIRVRQGDQLRLSLISSVAATVRVRATVLYDDGTDDIWTIPDFAAGSSRALEERLSGNRAKLRGSITDCMVNVVSTVVRRGQLYVRLFLNDGSNDKACIACGYIYTGQDVSLGQFVEAGPGGGEGFMRNISLGTPAAGADYAPSIADTLFPPDNTVWRMHGFVGALTTSATAADRWFRMYVRGSLEDSQLGCGAAILQAASLTGVEYIAGLKMGTNINVTLAGSLSKQIMSLSENLVYGLGVAGTAIVDRYVFSTSALQVGDQWSEGFVNVEEWLIPS